MSEAGNRTATRTVALVDADGGAAASALLSDAEAALPVYARLAGIEAPGLVRALPGGDVGGCDTVLLALTAKGAMARTDGLPRGVCVYALVCTAEDRPATDDLARLERECGERGLAWMGGLLIGDAGLLPQMARRPRMGWARRRVSEAVDQLLIALLARQPFGEKYVRPSRYARLTCRPR